LGGRKTSFFTGIRGSRIRAGTAGGAFVADDQLPASVEPTTPRLAVTSARATMFRLTTYLVRRNRDVPFIDCTTDHLAGSKLESAG
jgi:hypothetical protein